MHASSKLIARFKWWALGEPQARNMQQNFIIGICLFAAAGLIIGGLSNALTGMPLVLVAGSLIFGATFLLLFYLARFKQLFAPLYWPVMLTCALMLTFLWIFNGGLKGPVAMWSPIAIAASMVIGKGRLKYIGPLGLLAILYLMILLEYRYPHLILGYSDRKSWFIDSAATLAIAALIGAYLIFFMHQSYTAQREKAEASIAALEKANQKLTAALDEVDVLSGLLPICASCKKIRDDQGYWKQVDEYIGQHARVQVSHGICPECARKLYPDIDLSDEALFRE